MVPTDIGAEIKTVAGIPPTNAGAGAINGAAIDRQGFQSCTLQAACGAASGGPSAQTVDAKLQHSADGSTGWADIAGAAVTQMAADNGDEEVDVDLSVARRYLRVVSTVALTGGTTPKLPVAATVVLGGADETPA